MFPINPYLLWPMHIKRPAFSLRQRRPSDAEPIRAVMARAYPPPHGPEAVWREESLRSHLDVFAEGQLVIESPSREVVASATSMRTTPDKAMRPHTWREITGGGLLTTHDPEGGVLYGVNIVVDPAYQGQGLARKLYEGRIELARRLGCRWLVAGARIPGYHTHANHLSPEDYLGAVVAGEIFDPTLSKQLKVGFRCWGLLPHYAPDPETHGHAALIVLPLEGEHEI